jgi:hypothetical protein
MNYESTLESPKLKELIDKTVEKAIQQCIIQHIENQKALDQYQGKNEHLDALEFSYGKPYKVKVSLDFYFNVNGKDTRIVCSPIIDLSRIYEDE